MKSNKIYPLCILLFVSILMMQVFGWILKSDHRIKEEVSVVENPPLVYMCLGLQDGIGRWTDSFYRIQGAESSSLNVNAGNAKPEENSKPEESIEAEETKAEELENKEKQSLAEDESVVVSSNTATSVSASGTQSSETKLEPVVEYGFEKVDSSYFKDALFIGDSRMVGLAEYSGLEGATFYADVGLTIYKIFEKPFIKVEGKKGKITLEEALQKNHYKKIYLMIGINELGTGTTEDFLEAYTAAIEKIKKLQPDSIFFIQGILYVTAERSEEDSVINNQNIKMRNDSISMLANGRDTFYIDVNEIYTDSEGNLGKDYSNDNVHLKAEYYDLWTEFLMEHGILAE